MRKRREAGEDEADLLEAVRAIRPSANNTSPRDRRLRQAQGEYFVGSMLAQRKNTKAVRHFLNALKLNPLNPKAWGKLLLCVAGRWPQG